MTVRLVSRLTGMDLTKQVNMLLFACTETSKSKPVKQDACGQSYKQFRIVIYESRVVIWGIFKSGTTLEL